VHLKEYTEVEEELVQEMQEKVKVDRPRRRRPRRRRWWRRRWWSRRWWSRRRRPRRRRRVGRWEGVHRESEHLLKVEVIILREGEAVLSACHEQPGEEAYLSKVTEESNHNDCAER